MSTDTIGRYEIQRELGQGGMAIVYLAHDPFVKRQVAVKVLPRQFTSQPMFRARFQREAEVIAGLEHPSIVPVYDFGEHDGQPFIVMRYMPGGSLIERIADGPLSVECAVDVLLRIAAALDEAHARGIIHRDLKPGNILFDRNEHAFLSDFGIAKISEATGSLTGSGMIGTPAYMSPEQIKPRRKVDHRTDVYALGAVLFEMLTGERPFEADTPIQMAMMHLTEPIPPIVERNASLPHEFDDLIAWAMAKDPADRCASAGELAAAIADLAGGASSARPFAVRQRDGGEDASPTPTLVEVAPPGAAATVRTPREAARERRRGAARWLWGGPLLVLALVAGGYALTGGFGRPQAPAPTQTAQPVEVAAEATPTDAPLPIAATTPTEAAPETPTATRPPIEPVTANHQWTPQITSMDGVEMVLVPPGCFPMGSTLAHDAQPVVQQCFDQPFWIDRTEVTNQAYGSAGRLSGDNRPRDSVLWSAAQEFCRQRGARLLTEAEWEYAARGPDGLVYPWGNAWDANRAVHAGISDGQTADVYSQPDGASWVGALNMSGNVAEWVSSLYMPYPYVEDDGRETDQEGMHVARGGSYGQGAGPLLAYGRSSLQPGTSRFDDIGFRCARDY